MIQKLFKKLYSNKKAGTSLVEIIVSLAIFSFIISIVIGISIALARAQQRVQAEVFLTQTAQTTLENMSRNLRYGYAYSGVAGTAYTDSGNKMTISATTITQNSQECTGVDANGLPFCTNSTVTSVKYASSSQVVSDVIHSPVVIFERQLGNPTTFADQNAYCAAGGQLYKISNFQILSEAQGYERICSDGAPMLPEDVTLEYVYFDVLGQSSENPKNPMVRIRLRLSSELGGSIDMQTTVTQRLIQLL